MNREEAKKVFHLLLQVGEHLDQSVAFVRDHDDEDHFLEYRAVVGKLMGDMYLDAMTPLFERFPDLRPDYLGGPYKIPEEVYLPVFYEKTKSNP